ncbi:MAG: HEAT repeat domain-containing protein [Candidatus Acidiferrales bacterium]|jgi:hypothetical protein
MNARPATLLAAMAMALSLRCATQASAQKCPRGPIDVAALIPQMETTKDPNVILRAAAIAGQKVVSTLRKLSIPETSPETVGGAAQASLAKLGDEATYAELESELNRKDFRYTVWTLEKLLLVNTPRSISMIMAYLGAHPGPITLGCETDACYDDVPIIFNALADVVENAPIRTNGKFIGSREDWANWSKHVKPIPFSISGDLQDPYEQCLGRKVEWGFDMALVDLGATGDQRAVPAITKLGTMGYPYNGYVGTRAPYIWLRHDYVETALAQLGNAKEFEIVVGQLKTQSYQTAIQKLQIIGGRDAFEALVNSSNYFDIPYEKPFMPALSRMVQDPPLPPDADSTIENIRIWKDWWAKNKQTARFVKVAAFE